MKGGMYRFTNTRAYLFIDRIRVSTTGGDAVKFDAFGMPAVCVHRDVEMQETANLADFLIHRLNRPSILWGLAFAEYGPKFVVHKIQSSGAVEKINEVPLHICTRLAREARHLSQCSII